MQASHQLLLASHGTAGALAAEQAAIRLCAAGGTLHHLIVVPDFWKGMKGDDWLNNGITRDRFARYLESELGDEVDDNINRVRKQADEQAITYACKVVQGAPEECLIDAAGEHSFDMIVIGSPRPKGKEGLRSKMVTEAMLRKLRTPVLVVPYPDE